jgi:hypothetical protein
MKKQIIMMLLLILVLGWAISGCIDNTPKKIIPEIQRTMTLTANNYILDQSPDRLTLDTTTLTATILDENGVPMPDYEVTFQHLPADSYFIGDNPARTDSSGKAQITIQINKYNSIQNPTSMKMKSTETVTANCEDLDLNANVSIDTDVQDWVTLYFSGSSDFTFEWGLRTTFTANGIKIKFAVNDPSDWHTIWNSRDSVSYAAHTYYAFNLSQVKRGSTIYLFYQYSTTNDGPGEIEQMYLHSYNSWVHNVATIPSFTGNSRDPDGEFSYKIP